MHILKVEGAQLVGGAEHQKGVSVKFKTSFPSKEGNLLKQALRLITVIASLPKAMFS